MDALKQDTSQKARNYMDDNSKGISFCGLLAILFIALKLTGFISWSWLWVLSPIWIPTVIGIVILIIFLIL